MWFKTLAIGAIMFPLAVIYRQWPMGVLMAEQNIALEIEKLDELRGKGIITEQEFDQRKAQLLLPPVESKRPPIKRPGMWLAWGVIATSFIIGAAYGGSGGAILVAMFVQFFYLLPAFLAYQRAHPQRHAIFLINLFLGWTAIGWIGALVWSVSSSREKLA